MQVEQIGIVIVNWNSGEQLLQCLDSMTRYFLGQLSFEVIVVDNASADKSLALVEARSFSFPITIIKNSGNFGFAKACNIGAKAVKGAQYLLFLNPDTLLLEQEYVRLLDPFKENSRIGILGVQLIGETGEPLRSCARFPTFGIFLGESLGLSHLFPSFFKAVPMQEWDHSYSQKVDHVIGAFYLMKRELFDELNHFDERFFVYLEDLDFSLRAHQAGYDSFYFTEIRAFHKGGGVSSQVKDKRLFYSLRSRLLYIAKYFPKYQCVILFPLILLIEPITRIVFCLLRGKVLDVLHTMKAYKMLYGNLRSLRL